MTEHAFDNETVGRWRDAADRAHHEWCQWRSVNERASPAANDALLALKRLLAESMPKAVAEWSVSNWLITQQPIEACVAEELAEQRPWPSEASKLRGRLAPPLH